MNWEQKKRMKCFLSVLRSICPGTDTVYLRHEDEGTGFSEVTREINPSLKFAC